MSREVEIELKHLWDHANWLEFNGQLDEAERIRALYNARHRAAKEVQYVNIR